MEQIFQNLWIQGGVESCVYESIIVSYLSYYSLSNIITITRSFIPNKTSFDLFLVAMITALVVSSCILIVNVLLHTKLLKEARKINNGRSK